ncbi:WbqC family protein [Streptomyces europaeiscabiei]|uniref:WbqC family protein n=1 Tax=Streptomyces europaeiscabiei TaxID=146819 RepID=UPI0038F75F60
MQHTNPSSATASPAASSPDLPEPGGLCAIHQPNWLPRLTTLAKLFAADYWIVLDSVQFTRRDYQHRARLAALEAPSRQQWLSLPTRLPHGRPTLIRDARIADVDLARRRTTGMLHQHFAASPHWPALAQALDPVMDAFATGRTATVAQTSTSALLDLLGWKGRILTSSQLPSRTGRSERLADLAAATGARSYLCGTGGMTYLDPAPFADQDITVTPFRPPVISSAPFDRRISAVWSLATLGPDAVGALFRTVAAGHGALQPA